MNNFDFSKEINTLDAEIDELSVKWERQDRLVLRIQIYATVAVAIIAPLIAYLLGGGDLFTIAAVAPLLTLCLGSFGYEIRDETDSKKFSIQDKQNHLAYKHIENYFDGEIVSQDFVPVFGKRLSRFTMKINDEIRDYWVRVDKFTGEVFAYPKTQEPTG